MLGESSSTCCGGGGYATLYNATYTGGQAMGTGAVRISDVIHA